MKFQASKGEIISGEYITLLYCCLVTKSCLTLCDPMDCSSQTFLSFTVSWSLLKLMSIESVMPSNHLILCHLLLLLPSILPSIRVFSNESASRTKTTIQKTNQNAHMDHSLV